MIRVGQILMQWVPACNECNHLQETYRLTELFNLPVNVNKSARSNRVFILNEMVKRRFKCSLFAGSVMSLLLDFQVTFEISSEPMVDH